MTLTNQQRVQTAGRTDSWSPMRLARLLQGAALVVALGVVGPALGMAQVAAPAISDRPVILELYTAQGCASCPPADEMMLELARRDDVIALALHVDYWDYIGWADSFASPENGQRQQRYARRHGQSTIYTPQVIINGLDIVEGFRIMQVMDTIAQHRAQSADIQLTVSRGAGGGLEIRAVPTAQMAPLVAMASRRAARPNAVVGTLSMADMAADVAAPSATAPAAIHAEVAGPGSYSIDVVRYRASDAVDIDGGENAGRTAEFANIVTHWETVGMWDMASPLEMTVPIAGTDPVVVIVQEIGQGEIVAAARLR